VFPAPGEADPLAGGLLGTPVGGELDDGLASAVGDGEAAAERVGLGLALPPPPGQLVDVALGEALPDALDAAEAELAGAVTVAVLVAVLLAGVPGLVLAPALGLLLTTDGLTEGLEGGVVTGVADGLVRTEPPGLDVLDAFALAEEQDAAGFAVRRALPAEFAPPAFWLTGPLLVAEVAWLVEL
jgi:hypothetical protein